MLPKEKPQEGQLFWMLLLAVGWMVLGSAWGPSSSSSSSSDLHLLSPTPGAPLPPALPRPDHSQGPRHHQPPVSIYRSPASLRAGHGESRHLFFASPSFLPLSPPPQLSTSLCPFITAADPSQKEPSVATSLSFFSSSLCNRLAHFLPPTVPLSLSLRLALPLTLPPLPPRREEITTVDSSCASRSCASFMRL